MEKRIIQVEEKVPVKLLVPLSIQHMFAMFGASVLVPFVFGINPAIVLFMNGVGTLLFILITKGKAPAYLGSSFAFLAPAGIVITKFGYEYALGSFVAVGFCGCILALLIYKFGSDWIDIVLPPAAMGPVVALIGLELSGTAASNAGLLDEKIQPENAIVFFVTLGVAVFGSILTLYNGFLSMDPDQIRLIYTLGGKQKDVLTKVLLPGSVPLIISNMKVNIGLCLVGVIIGEFLSAQAGLGFLIIYGSQVFKLDLVIMSIVILCILSAILYQAVAVLERRCRQ